jgi:phage I-like protein
MLAGVNKRETAPQLPLIALRAITNGALLGDKLPDRLKLLNWGVNKSTQGDVILDDTTAKVFAANQSTHGLDRVALDFEHNTVPGSVEYERTEEPRVVAGYGTPELIPGDGLYLSAITYTAAGCEQARNYADLSPAVAVDSSGRVTMLASAALVRAGAVEGLSFFSAAPKSIKYMPETTQAGSPGDENTLSVAELAKAFGLPDGATKQDLLIALAKWRKEEGEEPSHEEEGEGETKALTALKALEGQVKALTATIAAKAKEDADAVVDGLVKRFSAEGKSPLGEDGKPLSVAALSALGAPALRALLASTPKTVALSASGSAGADGSAKQSQLKGLDRTIAAFNSANNK